MRGLFGFNRQSDVQTSPSRECEIICDFIYFYSNAKRFKRFIMGNRLSRKQDTPGNCTETAATEQNTAEEQAAAQPAEDSEIMQTQEAIEIENLDLVLGEPVKLVACLPPEECTSECKEVEAPAAPLNDAEPELVAKETPVPVQPEPVVLVSKTSPPESEPKPVAEAQLAPEPAPEPIPEPETTSNPEAEIEAVPEPISESVPALAEALEQQTDLLTQESLPEPVLSSPPLIDLGVHDVTPQPINTPPSPVSIPSPVNADEPSDIPMTQECQDSVEVSVISTFELERSE
ncbi:protein TsetseEP-like [Siniperca chuatsi]|uniref:protein TsetseEP-like n=1 Tax=Siniperca chuatsi TaxID=119488 RepID=UPI001CE1B02E|nr:protein TsetseEP-like [Siniperca chuatsi]